MLVNLTQVSLMLSITLAITKYLRILFQDISGNKLKEIVALNSLTHMLTLKADKNLLRSVKMDKVCF